MRDEDYDDELALGDYIAIIRRRWLWLAVPLVLVPVLAAIYSATRPLTYSATARVVLAASAAQRATVGSSFDSYYREIGLSNEVNFAYSDSITAQVESELGTVPSVTISSDVDSDSLVFFATAATPDAAAKAANVWAATYVDGKRAEAQDSITHAMELAQTRLVDLQTQRTDLREGVEQLRAELDRASDPAQQDQLQNEIYNLESEIAGDIYSIDSQIETTGRTISNLELANDLAVTGEARVTQAAYAPLYSSNTPISRNIVLGIVLGGIVGCGAALLRESLDQRLRNADAVARAVDIPVLASIPDPGRAMGKTELALAFQNAPGGVVADGYARLRTAFQFASISSPTNTLIVTSPNQSEGKTTTSVNLAHAMAAIDLRVVLCDLDFRRPRIHSVYGVPQDPGLSNVIVGDYEAGQVSHLPDSTTDHLAMITAGPRPPNPADFVASTAMGDLLKVFGKEADLIVIDAPPVLPVSDALALASQADSVLLVINAGSTKRRDLIQAVKSLHGSGTQIIGAVLVGVQAADGYGAYGQGYGSEA